jgi:hypothetical protein
LIVGGELAVTLCLRMVRRIECFSARGRKEHRVVGDYSVRNFVILTYRSIFLEF